MRVIAEKRSTIQRTGRVIQVEGLFDVPPSESSEL